MRILETTDVHGNLMAFDYHGNRQVQSYGLVRTAALIRKARRQAPNCLLFDNGDYLQGTPMSDLIATPGSDWTGTHPAITAMNALGYDAAALGNHEFNFGLKWLQRALEPAQFPVTCANLEYSDRNDELFPPFLILDRQVVDGAGQEHLLKVGVMGLTPPQTTKWDHYHLDGVVQSHDMLETAAKTIPRIRAAGADLIIILAHTGIGTGDAVPFTEHAALALAGMPGVDALLAGHSHEVFPSDRAEGMPGVSPENGTLHGTPAVMAGARGSHLGVLDLELERHEGRWSVSGSTSEARPVDPDLADDSELSNLLLPAHKATLALTQKPLGQTDRALHSYLALAQPSVALALVTRAQQEMVQKMLAGTKESDLPILSATAPFKVGGHGGPGNYTDIPPGPLTLRHAADLYSFPNLICAIRLNGTELREWLESAAVVFRRIIPGQHDQPLLDPDVPGHHFDVMSGVRYRIDLSQPARYDVEGRLIDSRARRIRDLTYQGTPVKAHDTFILATNNYRAFGAGPYRAVAPDQLVLEGTLRIQDIVADHIRNSGGISAQNSPQKADWAFCPMPGTSVVLDTGPGLRRTPEELTAIRATDLGQTEQGFMRIKLPL